MALPTNMRPFGINDELLLQFFLTFSRFEYAMKAAGLVRQNGDTAEPDWSRLINKIQALDPLITSSLSVGGEYLIQAPPKKQTLKPEGLCWEEVLCNADHHHVSCLLWSLKRVRNNLFHSSKFEVLRDLSDRNRRLVEGSLAVMDQLIRLEVCQDIYVKFNDYSPDET